MFLNAWRPDFFLSPKCFSRKYPLFRRTCATSIAGWVSIWQAGTHDNPFGQRLTCLMIAKNIPDAAVPMSLLADHPNVQFNYYRKGIGTCEVEMH